MPNTLHLINQVRRLVPKHTDYAVAKALEMSQSNLNKVLAGKGGLGPKAVIRLSELLKRDVRDLLVLVEEDKATRQKDIEFWGRRSPRITAAIAIAILGFPVAVSPTVKAATSTVQTYSACVTAYTLCEVWLKRIMNKISELCSPVLVFATL